MFKTVLVPIDVSVPDEARRLLTQAKTLSAPWNSDIHAVTVIPNEGMPIVGSFMEPGYKDHARTLTNTELDKLVEEVGISAKTHVKVGTIYDKVISLAESLSADLIMIGAHHPALSTYLLGSNAARVVRHSACSVLVLRQEG